MIEEISNSDSGFSQLDVIFVGRHNVEKNIFLTWHKLISLADYTGSLCVFQD